MAGGAEARAAAEVGAGKPGGAGGEGEGVDPGQSGTPLFGREAAFNYAKVRYRGLAKNTERIAILLGLSNLTTAQRAVGG